jgi:hypothetical protein
MQMTVVDRKKRMKKPQAMREEISHVE